jgi:sortase B
MQDGTMFGSLQMLYSAPPTEDADEREILIHLPGEVRFYDVFAAVHFDDTHILHTYDFSSKYWYGNFFERIRNIRSIDAWFDEGSAPEYGEQVILLSTSLADGSDGRFLVMAVFRDTAGVSGEVP